MLPTMPTLPPGPLLSNNKKKNKTMKKTKPTLKELEAAYDAACVAARHAAWQAYHDTLKAARAIAWTTYNDARIKQQKVTP